MALVPPSHPWTTVGEGEARCHEGMCWNRTAHFMGMVEKRGGREGHKEGGMEREGGRWSLIHEYTP